MCDLNFYLSKFVFWLVCLLSIFGYGCVSQEDTISPQEQASRSLAQFFAELKSGGITNAYYLTHSLFQKETPLKVLDELNVLYKLREHVGITTRNISLDKKRIVSISATMQLTGSIGVNFESQFSEDLELKGPNKWRLVFIDFDLRNYLEEQGMVEPSREVMLEMAKKYFSLFQRSARKRDFKEFYDASSEYWKYKLSLMEMNQIFQPVLGRPFLSQDFRDARFEINYGSGVRENGLLVLNGYISGPSRVDFSIELFFESGQFKPVGFNLKTS